MTTIGPVATCAEVTIVSSPSDIRAVNALDGSSADDVASKKGYKSPSDKVVLLANIRSDSPKITKVSVTTRNVKKIKAELYEKYEYGITPLSDVCTLQ